MNLHKKLISLSFMTSIFNVAQVYASDSLNVSYKLINQSGKAANIALSLGYDAQSNSTFCTNRSEDGNKFPKSIQRLVVLNNDQSQAEVEKTFGVCNYKLNGGAVAIISPEVVKNILARNGKEVGPGIYEFKGFIDKSIPMKTGNDQNVLNCKFADNRLAATCEQKEVQLDQSNLKLNVYLE